MTYWDGSRWTPEPAPQTSARPRLLRRFFGASSEAALITLLLFGLIAGTTLAAQGGRGGGSPHREVATCQIDGNVVSTTGLPTYEVINFMVTDANGKVGWVLGITWEGWWDVTVPGRSGPTTYEFVSRTYGNNGSRYTVYSSCSTSS